MLKHALNKQLTENKEESAPLKPVVINPGHCPTCNRPLEGRLVPIGEVNGVPHMDLMAWCAACDKAAIP